MLWQASFFGVNLEHKKRRGTMKTILQKKQTSKPSPKDIERVQIGIEMMQAQFQLMGY